MGAKPRRRRSTENAGFMSGGDEGTPASYSGLLVSRDPDSSSDYTHVQTSCCFAVEIESEAMIDGSIPPIFAGA
jgi:hypothetical protein